MREQKNVTKQPVFCLSAINPRQLPAPLTRPQRDLPDRFWPKTGSRYLWTDAERHSTKYPPDLAQPVEKDDSDSWPLLLS